MQNCKQKAKPALCFARIAKAILGDDVTLHNSNFLSHKKAAMVCPILRTCHGDFFYFTLFCHT
jgi:hypothetical protein